MRTVRFSATAKQQLRDLLAQGIEHYGVEFVEKKGEHLVSVVSSLLARHPRLKSPHPDLGLVVYPIKTTPFVVLYDFDDTELRVHLVLHQHADLNAIGPASVRW